MATVAGVKYGVEGVAKAETCKTRCGRYRLYETEHHLNNSLSKIFYG